MKFYLRTKGDERAVDYFWAGDGWWTRRKDQAKTFDTQEAAETERLSAVTVESVEIRQPADDGKRLILTPGQHWEPADAEA